MTTVPAHATAPSIAAQMMALFSGNTQAYGTYDGTEYDPTTHKQSIRRGVRTLRAPVTEALWEQHLNGTAPIGIIPTRQDGSCKWGAIDIDEYAKNLLDVFFAQWARYEAPFVPCRSKSGGLHLFLFLRDPIPADDVRKLLAPCAKEFGHGGAEIFPKFSHPADIGSWLIMPYFGNRHIGLKKNGDEMSILEFLTEAERRTVCVPKVKKGELT